MKNLLEIFSNMGIGKKLYLSYLLVVLIPISIIGLMLIHQISNSTQKGIIENATSTATQLSRRLSDVFQKSTIIIDSLILDDTLKRIAVSSYNSNYDFIQLYNSYNRIALFKSVTPEISEIKVFLSNPHMMENGELVQLTPELKASDWFPSVSNSPGKICLEYRPIPRVFLNKSQHLLLTYYLDDRHNGTEMLIVLAINPAAIAQVIGNSSYPAMIVDKNNKILFSTDEFMIGQNYDSSTTGKERSVRYGSQEYFSIQLPIEIKDSRDPLYLYTLVPLNEMSRTVNSSLITGFTAIMACLLLAVILIIIFARSLSYRIRKLRDYTAQVAEGNLELQSDLSGLDEIGQLAEDLSEMSNCIKQLMQDNEEYLLRQNALQIQHKNAQLRMLANQINPHFLFNTLDTIRMNVLREKDTRTAEAIQILADILRASLETVNKPIPLYAELKTAENYLNLIKFRFGSQFDFSIVCQDVDKNLPVLPFILQPLVENAVIHGLGDCAGEGRIDISVCYAPDAPQDVLLSIRDNGAGMRVETLNSIRTALLSPPYEEDGKHIGIPNVHKRLLLYYGSAYGLSISSVSGKGTVITARIMGG